MDCTGSAVMMNKATADRRGLQFPEAVLSSFAFLETEYRFRCVAAEETIVRFESPRVVVAVYHGRQSFEVGVEFALKKHHPTQEPPFRLADVAHICGSIREPGLPNQASSREAVAAVVRKLAAAVQECADPVLRGEVLAFRRMAVARSEKAGRDANARRVRDARAVAEEAWQRHDYTKVVDVLGSIRSELSAAERKKLEYARRHSH